MHIDKWVGRLRGEIKSGVSDVDMFYYNLHHRPGALSSYLTALAMESTEGRMTTVEANNDLAKNFEEILVNMGDEARTTLNRMLIGMQGRQDAIAGIIGTVETRAAPSIAEYFKIYGVDADYYGIDSRLCDEAKQDYGQNLILAKPNDLRHIVESEEKEGQFFGIPDDTFDILISQSYFNSRRPGTGHRNLADMFPEILRVLKGEGMAIIQAHAPEDFTTGAIRAATNTGMIRVIAPGLNKGYTHFGDHIYIINGPPINPRIGIGIDN